MKLPEKFQMRHTDNAGFTHCVKRVGDKFKVKWARGWAEDLYRRKGKVLYYNNFDEEDIVEYIKRGSWIIVDEKKPQEEALPDVIHFKLYGNPYVLTKSGCNWQCWHKGQVGNKDRGSYYSEEELKKYFADGTWERYEPVVLTAEQQRANKDCQERIAALNSSIKLNQQDIEHRNRLIANYEQQIKDLKAKIVEGDE